MRTSIYTNLKSSRSYTASTGLTQEEFEDLAHDFCALYQVEENHFPANFGSQVAFPDGKELLFLLLFYKKVYPTFDVLALSFGLANATVHRYLQLAKTILHTVLAQREVLPKRFFFEPSSYLKNEGQNSLSRKAGSQSRGL